MERVEWSRRPDIRLGWLRSAIAGPCVSSARPRRPGRDRSASCAPGYASVVLCAPADTRGGGVRACHNPTMRGNDPLPPSLTGAFRSASFCASAAWTLATSPVRSPISSRTESPAGGFRRRAPSGIGPYARLSVTAGFQPKVSESGTPMEACDWTNLQWPFSRTRTQVIRAGRSPPSARVKRPCPSAQATSPWM